MEKMLESISTISHQLTVSDRKQIMLTGIKKINSFDNEEFLMESNMGMILLKGSELEIIKLDTHDGNVSIKGHIDSFSYLDDSKKKEDSFLSKLFKWWIINFSYGLFWLRFFMAFSFLLLVNLILKLLIIKIKYLNLF